MSAEFPYRHKKRGGLYRVLYAGIMQCEANDLDESVMVVYEDTEGRIWIRPIGEFYDGRFEVVM